MKNLDLKVIEAKKNKTTENENSIMRLKPKAPCCCGHTVHQRGMRDIKQQLKVKEKKGKESNRPAL